MSDKLYPKVFYNAIMIYKFYQALTQHFQVRFQTYFKLT